MADALDAGRAVHATVGYPRPGWASGLGFGFGLCLGLVGLVGFAWLRRLALGGLAARGPVDVRRGGRGGRRVWAVGQGRSVVVGDVTRQTALAKRAGGGVLDAVPPGEPVEPPA